MKLLSITFFCFFINYVQSQIKNCDSSIEFKLQKEYTVYNIDSLKNDSNIKTVNKVRSLLNKFDLEKLLEIKEDSVFNKIVDMYSFESDFSFSSINAMFEYCNEKMSSNYYTNIIELDNSFKKKIKSTKILKIDFFYFKKSVNSEVYIYNYNFCRNKMLSRFSLSNSILLSPSNPFEGSFNEKLIGIEKTNYFYRYVVPIVFNDNILYMSVFIAGSLP